MFSPWQPDSLMDENATLAVCRGLRELGPDMAILCRCARACVHLCMRGIVSHDFKRTYSACFRVYLANG